MIDHMTRTQLAQDLCDRMVAKYPKQILLGAFYGSTQLRGDMNTAWELLEASGINVIKVQQVEQIPL